MIRMNLLMDQDTVSFLKSLPGTVSEHIRRAIDEYIEKIKSQKISASQSKKGGKTNG